MQFIAQASSQFTGPDVSWFALSPLLVLVGAALFLLLAGALVPRWPHRANAWITVAAAVAAGALAMVQWDNITDGGPSTLVGGALAFDTFAQLITIAICVALVGVALQTTDHLHGAGPDGVDRDNPEVYALYLVAAAGGVVMGAANDLIVLFLGLETLSLAFYVLAASDRRRRASQESGLKYFILGGFSSAFFLYGIALLYGAVGSTNLSEIVGAFDGAVLVDGSNAMLMAGIALLLVGFAFKVAAVPFHVWSPDVYQGAPTPVTSLFASLGKVAAMAALVRVFVVALGHYRDDWRPVIWVLAVASVVIGSVLAVVQTNVKRMLAYSSITHAGYILVGLEAAGHHAGEADSGPGVPAIAFYLLVYAVIVTGTFAVVALVARVGSNADGEGSTDLAAFRGLSRRHPAVALALTIFLVAQAGVPFTGGFVAKFAVIEAAVEVHSYAIAIIAMVAAVIGAFLYLRIIVASWMEEDERSADEVVADRTIPFASGLFIAAAAVFTIVVGVMPSWLLDATDLTVAFAR